MGKLDFLVIDSPPGTGDEPLRVAQLIPDITGVKMTTPQGVALLDALEAISLVELLKSKKLDEIAQKEKNQILGEVPFEPELVQASNKGKSFIREDNSSSKAM